MSDLLALGRALLAVAGALLDLAAETWLERRRQPAAIRRRPARTGYRLPLLNHPAGRDRG